ncbi:acyltransferase [Methylorubrum sp. SB2]|uniref:acyltransferase family protein n=1 Tax=Methylorubrum subtropicum TaxID=3138812 RepID=UPI00313CA38D
MSGADIVLPAGIAAATEPERDRAALLPIRYLPALDGLRAVAVLLVVASHAAPAHVVPGGFGVTLFFFISGYLLTGQLADEYLRTGRIDFLGFYLRRMLRLLPAALVFILASGAVFRAMGGSLTAAEWGSALLYGANYYDIAAGYRSDLTVAGAHGPVAVAHPFSILWSLAVEEHFYLVWPLALLALLRWGGWRMAAGFLVLVCLIEPAWRAHLHALCQGPQPATACGAAPALRIYAATDTRFDSLAFGALAALLVVQSETRRFLAILRARSAQAAALGLLAAGFLVRDETFRDVSRYSAQGVAFLILVPALLVGTSGLRRLLERRIPVLIGRLSYSIYLWHWLAGMVAAYAFAQAPLVQALVYLVLTALLSALGWFAIERPMLRLRRRAGSAVPATEPVRPGAACAPAAPPRSMPPRDLG